MSKGTFNNLKETLTSFVKSFIDGTPQPKKASKNNTCFLKDEFVKSSPAEILAVPVSKQVWVNGRSFTIVGNSQQELDFKVKKITEKTTRDLVETFDKKQDVQLFQNSYTEEIPVEENEWMQKRDVWIYEYCPA